ncbi:MAG: hypothetical protein M3419_09250, partial [Actinomycetota bacterium]|nr:hypothetical protein [Actinomycetota bacterium]
MAQVEDETLAARLARYPVDQYPVQHATTQFHLGSALLHAGETGPARLALSAAREVFGRAGMRLEEAKAAVMLGVALRAGGRLDEAATTFATAAVALDGLEQPAEQAAALYNLGLVRQDCADREGAQAAWSRARVLFLSAGCVAQAAAAARDHGGSLLTAGEVAPALALLEQSLALADQAGDEPGAGAAANTLG